MSRTFGEQIVASTLQEALVVDRHGNRWQYHSRSDRHSKTACWAIMFDLMRTCPLLRQHAAEGKIGFGINHELRDFRVNRKKNLDLVVCIGTPVGPEKSSLMKYGAELGVVLTDEQRRELEGLPDVRRGSVSNVLVALEAKACMTEHVKARPRLYDELASSFQAVHGDTNNAIAAAFVMINCEDVFASPSARNPGRVRKRSLVYNRHRQPDAAVKVLEKMMELPRRSDERQVGFDAIGIPMIDCRNDGSEVRINEGINARVDAIARYDALIQRLAHLYATKFGSI
ncbi:MAG TPA: hypothetical protein VMM36_03465 [Opitutaceae bacterium]|nr:hypothetical protein [Opitutaceae bacterium]